MPRSYNPFASGSPTQTTTIDPSSEKQYPRRTSLSKANQRLQSLFSAKKPDVIYDTDGAALHAANVAQQAYLNKTQSYNSATLSLPSICLSTATGEKSKTEGTTTIFQPPSPKEVKRLQKAHAEFGPLTSPAHKYSSKWEGTEFPDPIEDDPPYFYLIAAYISYLILIIIGHVRDFFGKRFRKDNYRHLSQQHGYAPLNSDFDNFYVRRLQWRINDCFARPVTGVPGRHVNLLDRTSANHNRSFTLTGTSTETLNMASYNYLGFAQSEGPCADAVEACIKKNGVSVASTRGDVGTTELHQECEELVARFIGRQSAMVFSMGFGTNATAFPAIVGKGCLIISDELNHSSIRTGMRLSGASIGIFSHNDMRDLERVLRESISQGQPRTHRPWKKILVAVEGLYSMEGTMCNLPALVRLRHKYKFHLYVDEAHSFGALGPHGRGVCDYFGIDPNEVDILMGTLTKSFGANGGYIAADKAVISKMRATNAGTIFGESPAPPVLTQIMTALRIINGEVALGQGEERLQRLAFNSRYLRLGLKRLGFITAGHDDSPIIPIMLYSPGKLNTFSQAMLRRKISVVVVAYPATPLVSGRARFCVSAAHTREDLDRMLEACDQVGEALDLKLSSGIAGGQVPMIDGLPNEEERQRRHGRKGYSPPRWSLKDVLERGVEDVKQPLR